MSDPIKLSMLINGESTSHLSRTPELSTESPSSPTDDKSFLDPSQDSKPKGKHRGRKRTLTGPPYLCHFAGCNKSFQRSEHLSRHKLNHNPKKIFSCYHTGCDKTFVRHDLLVRHLKRHENKIQKQKLSTRPSEFLSTVVSNNLRNDHHSIKESNLENLTNKLNLKNNKAQTPSGSGPATVKQIVQQHSNQNTLINSIDVLNIPDETMPTTNATVDIPSNNLNNSNNTFNNNTAPNLFNWLFPDANLAAGPEPTSHNAENYIGQANETASLQVENFLTGNNVNNVNNGNNNNTTSNTAYTNGNNSNFLFDLNEFNINNDSHNFFIVQDDFSPSSSSTGYFSSNSEHKSTSHNESIKHKYTLDNSSSTKDDLHSFQQSQGQQASESSAYQFDEGLLYSLTPKQMQEFEVLIPALKGHIDFTKLKFEKALKTYWNFFHPRFPMLHRPTFDSTDAPLLLLLSMIILGSKLFMCVDNITCPDEKKLVQPKSLADTISEPLRWLLFASPFFQPPAEVWIIQSLLMLEFYEKHCSSRKLHERSHLHHGTTIQLLRRSPTLGGAPTKLNNDASSEETDNWYKWIEIESMKRATFMCFYMDAIDAICMGHQMFIYSHQIQMTMPVADSVWESNFTQFNRNFKREERPRQFLIVLRDIMNGKPTKTNSFGKKILLAGLSAILFQIQQRDLQLFFGLDKFTNTISKNWRDLLTAAFAIWRNDVGSSCCSSKTAIDNLNSLGNSSQFSTSDTRCKCIAYHLAHIYMSISHYDIFIVCGAPWRMNVKPSSILERNAIKRRVVEWSKTRHCEVSVVQCYLAMFEMFLSPQDSTYEYQYDYLPDADLFFRSYMIGYILLVIWGYLYSKDKFKGLDLNHEDNKNGCLYLKKIRNQFTLKSEGIMLHTWFANPSGAEFYGDLMRWVNVLNYIEGIENILGLLDLVGKKLASADYRVVREVGKLLLFCKDRTIGSTSKEILEDMYHPD